MQHNHLQFQHGIVTHNLCLWTLTLIDGSSSQALDFAVYIHVAHLFSLAVVTLVPSFSPSQSQLLVSAPPCL